MRRDGEEGIHVGPEIGRFELSSIFDAIDWTSVETVCIVCSTTYSVFERNITFLACATASLFCSFAFLAR